MASVIKGIYIDVNKSVELYVKIEDKKLDFDLVYPKSKENDIGFRNYVNNLKRLLKVEYHKGQDGKVDGIGIYLGRFKLGEIANYQLFGKIDSSAKYNGYYYINSSEERLLSQGNLQGIEELGTPFERYETEQPITDLHTHLSGALTSDDIINLAEKFNPHIEIAILKKAGIDVEKYKNEYEYIDGKNKKGEPIKIARLAFNQLSKEDVEIYKSRLSIGVNAQETFGAMEDCYSFRHPVVRLGGNSYGKDVSIEDLFLEQLRCLARHYQKTGIKYAELSMSEICKEPEKFLMIFDKVMPIIEKEFPDVRLRFLGAIPRTLGKPDLKLRNENLLAVARSPYIAGLDVMAHEVNETNHFSEIIKDCLDYSEKNNDPNFVIRVHAGESDVHYNNVKQFLKIVNKYCNETGKQPPVIRIGHGINGFDDETIDLAKKLNAIIEINLSSNLALNNVDNVKQVFLKKYKERGLKIVVSTDGHGMYSTDSHQEVELALAAGFTPEDIKDMVEGEKQYVENAQKSYGRKKANHRAEKLNYLADLAKNIKMKLEDSGINLDKLLQLPIEEAANQIFRISITSSVGRVYMVTKEEIVELLKKDFLRVNISENMFPVEAENLVSAMPKEFYIMNHSVNQELAKELAERSSREKSRQNYILDSKVNSFTKYMKEGKSKVKVYNQTQAIPKKDGKTPVCIIGYVDNQWNHLSIDAKREIISETTELVASLNPEQTFLIASTQKNGFNEVLINIIKRVNPKLEVIGLANEEQLMNISENDSETLRWIKSGFDEVKIEPGNQFAYSTHLADYLKENNGKMVAFGDGSHLKDHIINLHNKNGNVHLYNGKFSGSSKVDFLRGNGYEFEDSSDLLEQMGIKSKLDEKQIEDVVNDIMRRMPNARQRGE